MPATVRLVALPALSLTDALAERSSPSPVIVLVAGQPSARPDSSSEQVQATVTSCAYQPSPFGAVVAAPSEGAVSSTLIPVREALPELPAASVAEALTCWSAPSVTALDAGHASIPDSASEQLKLTVTAAAYQPFALGARSATASIVGSVSSMETVAGSVAWLPALSTAVPGTGWSLPSVVTVCGPVQLATPDWVSEQVKVTVTAPLFQPLALAVGARSWLMVGGVLTILASRVLAASTLPALSTLQNSTV